MPALATALVFSIARAPASTPEDPSIVRSFTLSTTPPPVARAEAAATGCATGQDLPDAVEGNQTHLVYFVPVDAENRGYEPQIAGSVATIRSWFARETTSAGLAARTPRFDRVAGGAPDVTCVQGDQPSASYTGIQSIAQELATKGFNAPNKRYLVYAETRADGAANPGSICGEAYYPLPGVPRPQVAVIYLGSNCSGTDFGGRSETIAVHEWLHLEGVVPLTARHHCPWLSYGHVCTGAIWMIPPGEPTNLGRLDPEAPDIMYPIVWHRLEQATLDRNRDDYLDHGLPMTDLRASTWMD